MNKAELVKDLKSYANSGFITRKKFADYMGVSDAHNVDKYLSGLDRVNGKYYFIPDVAENLYRMVC